MSDNLPIVTPSFYPSIALERRGGVLYVYLDQTDVITIIDETEGIAFEAVEWKLPIETIVASYLEEFSLPGGEIRIDKRDRRDIASTAKALERAAAAIRAALKTATLVEG